MILKGQDRQGYNSKNILYWFLICMLLLGIQSAFLAQWKTYFHLYSISVFLFISSSFCSVLKCYKDRPSNYICLSLRSTFFSFPLQFLDSIHTDINCFQCISKKKKINRGKKMFNFLSTKLTLFVLL